MNKATSGGRILELVLGILLLTFWIADSYIKTAIFHTPYRMLWYSSAGLFVTGIALLKRSSFLITSMFCALFFIEGVWTISFLSVIFLHKDIFSIASYAFNSQYSSKDFYITLFHLLLAPAVMLGVVRLNRIHQFGWVGAMIFTLFVAILSYLFVRNGQDNVNCVLNQTSCVKYFSFFYKFGSPQRIFLAVFAITLMLFYPTNRLLERIKN